MSGQLQDEELDLLRGKTTNPDTLKAIATLDRKREWIAKLEPLIPDTRVWKIVADIVETGLAYAVTSDYGHVAVDIMGCKPIYYPPSPKARRKGLAFGEYQKCLSVAGRELVDNQVARHEGVEGRGVTMSMDGWKAATPLVQTALDALGVPYEAGALSGLVCKLGRHHWERVYNLNGLDLPEFNFSCGLPPYFKWWSDLQKLPMTWRIVNTEGFGVSHNGMPSRPSSHPQGRSWLDFGDAVQKVAPRALMDAWFRW